MIKKIQVGGTTYEVGQMPANIAANFSLSGSSGNNLTIGSGKHLNFEPATGSGDIQFKPGDDITFYSHHRAIDKLDEVSLKVYDGDDLPVKLQINAAEITASTKGKTGTNANVFDLTVNSDKGTRGYLKVRAQAIDLRSESHGGIALQPKGHDGEGNMNKIKFEHGGGDGLEFGTFNTEKASLFTDEYRFNRNGVVKMATRETIASDKADASDSTTALKYVKQADDFYDKIDVTDEQTTWHDIIKSAYALNHRVTADGDLSVKAVETSVTSKGNLEIATTAYTKNGALVTPNINIESAGSLALKGTLDFGSTFGFGETDLGIETQYKITKKNAVKDCGILRVVGVNNSTTEKVVNDVTLPAAVDGVGSTTTIAEASLLDIIKFVNWAKANNFGPWAA